MNVIVVNGTQARAFDDVEPFVTGQSNFDRVEFQFDDAWDGMTKKAQFKSNGYVFNVDIDSDNVCMVPAGLHVGECAIRVRGVSGGEGVIATANEVIVPVVQGFDGDGSEGSGGGSGGMVVVPDGETLVERNGVLRVNCATKVEKDNTLPVTSAAVHVEIGNIEALLAAL